jgi:hypothetical protein
MRELLSRGGIELMDLRGLVRGYGKGKETLSLQPSPDLFAAWSRRREVCILLRVHSRMSGA